MSKSITWLRKTKLNVVICVLACLSIGPSACIYATDFADFALVQSLAAQAPGASYTYTLIADVSNCINVGNPVLNNRGEAAFVASCHEPIGPPGRAVVVRRGNGGPLTEIYTFRPDSTFSVPESSISINDNGTVAFPGYTPYDSPIRSAILVGDGGPISVIADTAVHTQFKALLRPSINNLGAVAFQAATGASGYNTVVVATGGNFMTIAGPGSVTSSLGVLTGAFEPELNNTGNVAFFGQGVSNFGLLTGSGGPLTPISLRPFATSSSINDLGRVAFVAYVANSAALQVADGGWARTLASYPTYQFGGEASVNNASLVAFDATVGSTKGIFVGPDPVADVVIKAGDVLPGCGTVVANGVAISEEALNDRGQVAFSAICDGGAGATVRAVVRADPVRAATMTTLGPSPSRVYPVNQ